MWSTSAIHRRQYTLARSARIDEMDLCRSDAFAPNIFRLLSVCWHGFHFQLHSLFYFRSFCSRIFSEYIKFYRESFCINKQFELEFPIQIFIGKLCTKEIKVFSNWNRRPFLPLLLTYIRPNAHTYTKGTLKANKTIFQWILIHNVVGWHERERKCVCVCNKWTWCAYIIEIIAYAI